MTTPVSEMSKGIMPDLVDPNHQYVFRTGEYGIYDYWYKDMRGNYWKYTNAPEDNAEFDPHAGVPLLDRNQPMPAEDPSFFTLDGRKRHMGVPEGVESEQNKDYNALDMRNIWFEVFEVEGRVRYVYLDSDIRENLDLWTQYQLRVTDAGMFRLRQFAVDKFSQQHIKDRIIGSLIMLMDQAKYELNELVNASVGDIEFIDNTIKLLGRKFVCDPAFLDFMTSLTAERDASSPLFTIDTVHGKNPLGPRHVYSIFHYLRISPTYLLCWHATQMYSRIFNRLAAERVSVEEIEAETFSEVQRAFSSRNDIQFMVDVKVREALIKNYGALIDKSFTLDRAETDDYGVNVVLSSLNMRKDDEAEFSNWLHSAPMHNITSTDQIKHAEMLSEIDKLVEEEKAANDVGEGSVGTEDISSKGEE